MFLNEARLIASIRHHNVAEILDLGSHDSLLYLVLEWIEGDSLALLERSTRHDTSGPIPVPVGLRIVAQMCAGLNAAHELRDRSGRRLNVVHRDVSPQNVLVSVTGEVKLIDFGIAKAFDQLTTNTSTGVLKGKNRAFMSPEQALSVSRLDARADIWSAGVVLYQLLSGQLPFRGSGQLDTLHIIGACKRVAPIPGLPTILQRLLDRVLEPDREKRIGSAAELGIRIGARGGSTRPSHDPEIWRRWCESTWACTRSRAASRHDRDRAPRCRRPAKIDAGVRRRDRARATQRRACNRSLPAQGWHRDGHRSRCTAHAHRAPAVCSVANHGRREGGATTSTKHRLRRGPERDASGGGAGEAYPPAASCHRVRGRIRDRRPHRRP